jgi:uncharacterized protein
MNLSLQTRFFFLALFLFCEPACFSDNACIPLHIGDKSLQVEVARSNKERGTGLQNRESLGKNTGMLFIFDKPQMLHFWMNQTSIPLSIAFINDQKKIVQIEDLIPYDTSLVRSREKCLYALEVNRGWFKINLVEPGTFIEFTSPV